MFLMFSRKQYQKIQQRNWTHLCKSLFKQYGMDKVLLQAYLHNILR